MSDGPSQGRRSRTPWYRRHAFWFAAWFFLLAASNIVQLWIPQEWWRPPGPACVTAEVNTPVNGPVRLAWLTWPAQGDRPHDTPVVLLHGSPGQAADFVRLAPLIARQGYRVISIDQLGFGMSSTWVNDYSIKENAHAILALFDTISIDRAHVIGWSNGGGTAMHMADLAPTRIASLSLVGSIGLQEAEGSGSYAVEHAKYALGWAVFVAAPELIPHFGLFAPREPRHAFIRFFWDSDQRKLADVMRRISVPTLILHGRDDVLVPEWAAHAHHALIASSRLVILNANHFIPFTHPELMAEVVLAHISRHDAAGVAPLRSIEDRAPPIEARTLWTRWIQSAGNRLRQAPWIQEVSVIALVACTAPLAAATVGGVLCAHTHLDPFVLAIGLACGWLIRWVALAIAGSRRAPPEDWIHRLSARPLKTAFADQFLPFRRDSGLRHLLASRSAWSLVRGVAIAVWAALIALASTVLWSLARAAAPGDAHTLFWLAIALAVWLLLGVFELGISRSGRHTLRARWTRAVRLEYWPAWLFYSPLVPYAVYLGRRHGAFMAPSCCNPAIDAGGGIVGESKSAIMRNLAHGAEERVRPAVLPTLLIDPGAAEDRTARAIELAQAAEIPWPFILKPDAGQRGYAVRLMRGPEDVLAYFSNMKRPAVLQPYHPGPHECGILWARSTSADRGGIFSITRKTFPVVTGDGRRTLEELIESHPRFRCQAPVFLARFAGAASSIPAEGQSVRLAVSGNHCQGTLFEDGADLITPELERAVDDLARGFGGGGLDFGRFDIRYTSEEELRRGTGFAVVELNGTFSESTNLYDPSRSPLWAYAVLFRQWRTLYALGARRRDAGARPMTIPELFAIVRAHFADRDGPAIAD